ncbi:uncharacterized protein LOC126902675 isoform X2 [Daktulosphaira vitifoliae]|uniref:uncharacterized protein LOC126902675 isoform X2 n=1 Tax=Daktulosphaira vitifoliae TaxID=58002 RepID=UPI0021AA51F3|nr:uncharacterized protein LOC126902675 isoform X2 [Daktulosphaira vitifoliae]
MSYQRNTLFTFMVFIWWTYVYSQNVLKKCYYDYINLKNMDLQDAALEIQFTNKVLNSYDLLRMERHLRVGKILSQFADLSFDDMIKRIIPPYNTNNHKDKMIELIAKNEDELRQCLLPIYGDKTLEELKPKKKCNCLMYIINVLSKSSEIPYDVAVIQRKQSMVYYATEFLKSGSYSKQKLCSEGNDLKCKLVGLIIYTKYNGTIVKQSGGCENNNDKLECNINFETVNENYTYQFQDKENNNYFGIEFRQDTSNFIDFSIDH